jgi:hypothetical protein
MFKIESNVPVPVIKKGRRKKTLPGRDAKYPFREMDVGQSFFVPGDPEQLGKAVLGCARRVEGAKFRMQIVTGIRIWRVE